VQTTSGQHYLLYNSSNTDSLGTGRNIHHGLGTDSKNGEWQTFTRDLQADLHDAQPDKDIVSVNGLLVRGSGRFDNIKLIPAIEAVYEDAEDGTTEGWTIYDDDPPGAQINNVMDEDNGSQVIELTGAGGANGYQLGDSEGAPWNDDKFFIAQWAHKYSENYTIYIDVQTTSGQHYLLYNSSNTDTLGTGRNIHHGLGTDSKNGQWQTFARDLQADLHDAQPDKDIVSVNGFLVRGSGRVDNIKLRRDMP